MPNMKHTFEIIDQRFTAWMASCGILFLRISLGIVFVWFGVLKFFPGLSPAQDWLLGRQCAAKSRH